MINFYQQTGLCGLIILILSFIAIYMAIRGIILTIFVKKQSFNDNSLLTAIILIVKKEIKENQQHLINALLQDKLHGIYSSMYFLKLTAAIGPLLGLLGTVIGMIDVFDNLSQNTIPNPSILALGIWQALITTVLGLCLAIPSLLIHYYLLANLRHFRNTIILKLKDL